MNNPYLKIFNHFGQDAQIDKLLEEVHEFIEAIKSGDMAHATEEYADVMVCMKQFRYAHKLDFEEIERIDRNKVIRTLDLS